MKISNNCIKLTKLAEGFRSKPYVCSAGKPTIGYGSTFYENGKPVTMNDAPISEERATLLFMFAISSFEKSVNSLLKTTVNQNQFDALVDFCYNVGPKQFAGSSLLKKVNANPNDPTIADSFRAWRYGGDGTKNGVDDDEDGLIDEPGEKKRIQGLANRREAQIELYFRK